MLRILKRSSVAAAFCALSMAIFAPLAFAADTPADAQYHLGTSAEESQKYAEAIGYFDKALQLDPNCWKAYGSRGAARYNVGDYKGALSDTKIAIPHFPNNDKLKNIVSMCENKLNGGGASGGGGGADMAAKREAVRQMLLNAQFGNDITNPGFQILMAARRRAGLNPMTGMPLNSALGVGIANVQGAAQNRTFADPNATNTSSVNSKLEAMSKGVHVEPQAHASASSTSHTVAHSAEPAVQHSALDDSLSMRVSSLAPPNLDSETSAAPASPVETPTFSEPTPVANTSAPTLAAPAAGGSLVTALPPRAASRAQQFNYAKGPRLSADNDARDSKTNMTAQNYFDRACGKGQAMDFQGAIKDYDEAIKLNPNHGPAYANRGSTRFNSGDHNGALEDFNMAVELMPDNVGIRDLRDRVAKSLGK